MINTVQQQIKEIEKLRSLQQNIDPSAQQQMAYFTKLQTQLKDETTRTVQSLGYNLNLLQNRNFATSCTDEISLLTQIAKMEFQCEPTDLSEELCGNEDARFKTSIFFSSVKVGCAVGRNKKQSKLNACKHIL